MITPQPRWMALSQGSYYVLTGLWPLLHRSSFLAVTDPKVDLWLVNTVGSLLAVTGLVLSWSPAGATGVRRPDHSPCQADVTERDAVFSRNA